MAREKLTKEAVEQALATLPGWTLAADGLSIARTFTFKNFSEAFAFMTRVGTCRRKARPSPGLVECLQDRRGQAQHA